MLCNGLYFGKILVARHTAWFGVSEIYGFACSEENRLYAGASLPALFAVVLNASTPLLAPPDINGY